MGGSSPVGSSWSGNSPSDLTFQFENLASILKLPGKKTFNNMDREFLEKRKKDLNAYLQVRACALWRVPSHQPAWTHIWNLRVSSSCC